MKEKEYFIENVNQLINSFVFDSTSIRTEFTRYILAHINNWADGITRETLTISDRKNSIINLLSYIDQYSRSKGINGGLILYPNKDDINNLKPEDFEIDYKDYNSSLTFLDRFLNKDYRIGIFSSQGLLCKVDRYYNDPKFQSEISYLFYNSFMYVHSILVFTREDLFTTRITQKNDSFTRLNVAKILDKESNSYSTSPNLSYSKINHKEILNNAVKMDILKHNIAMGVESPTNLVLEHIPYTFGVEIETCLGLIPHKEYTDLNMSSLYDGSLKDEDGVARGGEYVTGVLVGDAGVSQLRKIVSTLVKNGCKVNNKCSVHLHIGSCNFNKENLLSMYLLGLLVEDEFFSMFPRSRKLNVYCRQLTDVFKKEDYQSLANIENLSKIEYENLINKLFDLRFYNYVATGKEPILNRIETANKPDRRFNKLTSHPGGAKCGYDKNMQRYCWLNFVTCLYSNKGPKAKTLEFRLHNGTLNFKKILAWLKICMAFTWFAENHKKSIFKGYYTDEYGKQLAIDLNLILKLAYPKSNQVLINYVDERKVLFLPETQIVSEIEEYNESLNTVTSFKLKELFDIT